MAWTGNQIQSWISKYFDKHLQIQPNGIDLTVAKILTFQSKGTIDLDNSQRQLPTTEPLELTTINNHQGWFLAPGGYLLRYHEHVKIPNNVIGLVLPRSSLMRAGGMINTAIWDAGYSGQGLGLLQVHNPHGINILEHARMAQLIYLPTQVSTNSYSGVYQGEKEETPQK